MTEIVNRLNHLLKTGEDFFNSGTENEFAYKPSSNKWSKKEILGHLIDSAINNLQRFTEIQYSNRPYKIRKYNQDELVKANFYNEVNTEEIITYWIAINRQILHIIQKQDSISLAFKIELDNGNTSDFGNLIEDYVNHMEHHIKQITNKVIPHA